MDRQIFLKRADACLTGLEDWLEDFDPDELDYTATDGVLAFEFPDGIKFILNRQAGNHQMWYAAGVRAWHYDFDEEQGQWRDAKDGHELLGRIGETLSEKLGRPVKPA